MKYLSVIAVFLNMSVISSPCFAADDGWKKIGSHDAFGDIYVNERAVVRKRNIVRITWFNTGGFFGLRREYTSVELDCVKKTSYLLSDWKITPSGEKIDVDQATGMLKNISVWADDQTSAMSFIQKTYCSR